MKKFLRFTMWVLFFFALFVLIAFFFLLPSEIRITREIQIESSPKIVFSQINDLHNWEKWSQWHQSDPTIQTNYIKRGVGERSGFEWKSENKKTGSGSLTITESVKYDSVVISMAFMKRGEANNVFKIAGKNGHVKLSWHFKYNLEEYPGLIWQSFRIKSRMKDFMDTGLSGIKTVCEIQEQQKQLVVELEELNSFSYVSLRKEIHFNNVSQAMADMFNKLSTFIQHEKKEQLQHPFAIYHSVINEHIDLECGIPLVNDSVESDLFQINTFVATHCAVVNYYGDYSQLEKGHTAIQKWIEKRRFTIAGPPIEMYITDPATEPDPGKWLTKLYYPVY